MDALHRKHVAPLDFPFTPPDGAARTAKIGITPRLKIPREIAAIHPEPRRNDISYIKEEQVNTKSHSPTAAMGAWGQDALIAAKQRDQGQQDLLHRMWSDISTRTTQPSGRMEAVQLTKALDSMFAEIDVPVPTSKSNEAQLQFTERRYVKELQIWDLGFSELSRQVFVHCNERGQLLERLRERYLGFYETRQELFALQKKKIEEQAQYWESEYHIRNRESIALRYDLDEAQKQIEGLKTRVHKLKVSKRDALADSAARLVELEAQLVKPDYMDFGAQCDQWEESDSDGELQLDISTATPEHPLLHTPITNFDAKTLELSKRVMSTLQPTLAALDEARDIEQRTMETLRSLIRGISVNEMPRTPTSTAGSFRLAVSPRSSVTLTLDVSSLGLTTGGGTGTGSGRPSPDSGGRVQYSSASVFSARSPRTAATMSKRKEIQQEVDEMTEAVDKTLERAKHVRDVARSSIEDIRTLDSMVKQMMQTFELSQRSITDAGRNALTREHELVSANLELVQLQAKLERQVMLLQEQREDVVRHKQREKEFASKLSNLAVQVSGLKAEGTAMREEKELIERKLATVHVESSVLTNRLIEKELEMNRLREVLEKSQRGHELLNSFLKQQQAEKALQQQQRDKGFKQVDLSRTVSPDYDYSVDDDRTLGEMSHAGPDSRSQSPVGNGEPFSRRDSMIMPASRVDLGNALKAVDDDTLDAPAARKRIADLRRDLQMQNVMIDRERQEAVKWKIKAETTASTTTVLQQQLADSRRQSVVIEALAAQAQAAVAAAAAAPRVVTRGPSPSPPARALSPSASLSAPQRRAPIAQTRDMGITAHPDVAPNLRSGPVDIMQDILTAPAITQNSVTDVVLSSAPPVRNIHSAPAARVGRRHRWGVRVLASLLHSDSGALVSTAVQCELQQPPLPPGSPASMSSFRSADPLGLGTTTTITTTTTTATGLSVPGIAVRAPSAPMIRTTGASPGPDLTSSHVSVDLSTVGGLMRAGDIVQFVIVVNPQSSSQQQQQQQQQREDRDMLGLPDVIGRVMSRRSSIMIGDSFPAMLRRGSAIDMLPSLAPSMLTRTDARDLRNEQTPRDIRRREDQQRYENKRLADVVAKYSHLPARSLQWLRRFIRDVYIKKISGDASDDRVGQTRTSMPEFLFEYLKERYGTKQLVHSTAGIVIASLRVHRAMDTAIDTFAKFVEEVWDQRVLSEYLRFTEIYETRKMGQRIWKDMEARVDLGECLDFARTTKLAISPDVFTRFTADVESRLILPDAATLSHRARGSVAVRSQPPKRDSRAVQLSKVNFGGRAASFVPGAFDSDGSAPGVGAAGSSRFVDWHVFMAEFCKMTQETLPALEMAVFNNLGAGPLLLHSAEHRHSLESQDDVVAPLTMPVVLPPISMPVTARDSLALTPSYHPHSMSVPNVANVMIGMTALEPAPPPPPAAASNFLSPRVSMARSGGFTMR